MRSVSNGNRSRASRGPHRAKTSRLAHRRTQSTTRRAPVAHRLKPVLHSISAIRDLRGVRLWKKLTLRQWAGVLEIFGHKADRKTINHWELDDRPVPQKAFSAYADAVAWRVNVESGGALAASLRPDGRVDVRRVCKNCQKPFRFKRLNEYKCKRCRRKNRR